MYFVLLKEIILKGIQKMQKVKQQIARHLEQARETRNDIRNKMITNLQDCSSSECGRYAIEQGALLYIQEHLVSLYEGLYRHIEYAIEQDVDFDVFIDLALMDVFTDIRHYSNGSYNGSTALTNYGDLKALDKVSRVLEQIKKTYKKV